MSQVYVRYSFVMRYESVVREAFVPVEQLIGLELDVPTVRDVVENDSSLLSALFLDDLQEYLNRNEANQSVNLAGYYNKDLERQKESIQMVTLDADLIH